MTVTVQGWQSVEWLRYVSEGRGYWADGRIGQNILSVLRGYTVITDRPLYVVVPEPMDAEKRMLEVRNQRVGGETPLSACSAYTPAIRLGRGRDGGVLFTGPVLIEWTDGALSWIEVPSAFLD